MISALKTVMGFVFMGKENGSKFGQCETLFENMLRKKD